MGSTTLRQGDVADILEDRAAIQRDLSKLEYFSVYWLGALG